MNTQISRGCRQNPCFSRCALAFGAGVLSVVPTFPLHAQPPDPPVEWTQDVQVAQPIVAPARAEGLPPFEAESARVQLMKAHCNDKYRMLLKQIYAPGDAKKFGAFRDLGTMISPPVAGWENQPVFWVYAAPYWYVWQEAKNPAVNLARRWGPEQAVGKPDTPVGGDMATAWASRSPDDAEEWLMLEYAQPMISSRVRIHETYNVGAVSRISLFTLAGEEVEIYRGTDALATTLEKNVPPVPVHSKGIYEVRFQTTLYTNRIKITLDSPRVKGWNEIDAVALVNDKGETQWASAAAASSTYAQVGTVALPVMPIDEKPINEKPINEKPLPEKETLPAAPVDNLTQRIDKLEDEVRQLKAQVDELKQKDAPLLRHAAQT